MQLRELVREWGNEMFVDPLRLWQDATLVTLRRTADAVGDELVATQPDISPSSWGIHFTGHDSAQDAVRAAQKLVAEHRDAETGVSTISAAVLGRDGQVFTTTLGRPAELAGGPRHPAVFRSSDMLDVEFGPDTLAVVDSHSNVHGRIAPEFGLDWDAPDISLLTATRA